jgi:hypothetical protein
VVEWPSSATLFRTERLPIWPAVALHVAEEDRVSTTVTEFSLRGLASEVALSHASADYHDWVDEFLASIPDEFREHAVRQMATAYLRVSMHNVRHDVTRAPDGTPTPSGSSRWTNAARAYKVILAQPLNLASGPVRLGDANREQVLEAAEQRHEMAAANAREAIKFRKLADVMRRRKAKSAGELPEDVILAIFGGNDD